MGFMARRLFNMERQNNEQIVELLARAINPSVKVELSEAACHEEVTKHSSILLTFPDGETINQYRCRMRWFMTAPGQPTLPMSDLSATDIVQSARGIATVVNDLVRDMEAEAVATQSPPGATQEVNEPLASEVTTKFNECIQCGEKTNRGRHCENCL